MELEPGALETLNDEARGIRQRFGRWVAKDRQTTPRVEIGEERAADRVAGLGKVKTAVGRRWDRRIRRTHDRVPNEHQLNVVRWRILRPAFEARALKVLHQPAVGVHRLRSRVAKEVEPAVRIEEGQEI